MAFDIIHKGKVLTKEELESVKDIVMLYMNGKLSKKAFQSEIGRRLENTVMPETSIQVGDKKTFGKYTLFVYQGGHTTEIEITKTKFDELISFGCRVTG